MPDELKTRTFKNAAEFERWLAAEHEREDGLWVKFAKKSSGIESVTYAEAVEAALCFGWIDGRRKGLDDDYFLQRFTPRRARSIWSKINCERVTRLIAAGRMQPAGQAQIDAAQADGRWDAAYSSFANAEVPDDLHQALEGDELAASHFSMLSAANRYSILYHLETAKKPETRARRLGKYLALLRQGKGPRDG